MMNTPFSDRKWLTRLRRLVKPADLPVRTPEQSSKLPTPMGLLALLVCIGILFFIFALFSLSQQNPVSALIWAAVGLAQWGVAVRSPGFSVRGLAEFTYITMTALRQRRWRRAWAVLGLVLAGVAYLSAWGNQFNTGVMLGWVGAMFCCWWALAGSIPHWLSLPKIHLNRRTIALCLILLIGAVALFYNLNNLPRDMISDHVEYVLDTMRVRAGVRDIYFEANSGREPLFIYLSTLASYLFGGPSYMSLKFVSASAALLMLPVLYVTARQMDGVLTGLFTAGIASVSLWTIIMGRLGFRVMLAALASALLLLTLWRALRSGRRGDFLLAGLVLGLGQYGYSSFRIAPLVAVLALFFYAFQQGRRGWRDVLLNSLALFGMALAAFIPLLSFSFQRPDIFWTRTNNLVGTLGLDVVLQVLSDLLATFLMLIVGSDPVELNILRGGAPVLSPLVAGCFLFGLAFLVWRGWRKGERLLLFLPLAFVLLLLPSALAVGTPLETPSARRAITALPAVMLLSGFGLSFIVKKIYYSPRRYSHILAYLVGGSLLGIIAISDLTAYATEYPLNYHPPPARAVAQEILRFQRASGSLTNVFLIYGGNLGWIDPRAVAIPLGRTELVNVPQNIDPQECLPRADQPLMVLLTPGDTDDYNNLRTCFPHGQTVNYLSPDGSTFIMYFVNPLRTLSGQPVFK